MSAVFNTIRDVVVGITDALYATQVTWVDGANTYTGMGKYRNNRTNARDDNKGLGKAPTMAVDKHFTIDSWSVELTQSDFPGLLARIKDNQKLRLTIDVEGENKVFTTMKAEALRDGKCMRVELRPVG